ncbi:GntR family transcriptional regulator [Streptomyces sp. NBC_01218]|uniref:GntR family transcriptional regulator n=1 Tax=unclassified Streptomyces TaxID=2593676 RepID=UPI0023B8BC93|nr:MULTISPECIES: GntR family transcriptional regulator [unclassified Streptomyces]WEH40270.1 GntR family transcriptional regulator [Streptomyces sp. AM 2-1-1]WSQ51970.1 GntR family transcriptional regulator [Streptomyces sp. NBC_01218]
MPKEASPGSGEQAKQLALSQLRQAILRGEMAPAQRLVENELAERFGVTRASIRAALIDLAAQGLVERIRNRGSRVRVVTVEEAVAITECRMALEGLCAAKAAVLATEAQREELTGLGALMAKAVAEGDPLTYSELNHQLHTCVREFSGQRTAVELLERLNGQLVRHQFQLALRPGRPQQSLSEHLAMIEAIVAGEPQAAEQAVRAHLSSVIDVLRA